MFANDEISISAIPDQREELASIKMVNHLRGFIAIERKKDLKKRIGRSPDYADAIMMMCGCFDEVPVTTRRKDRYVEKDELEYEFTPETC